MARRLPAPAAAPGEPNSIPETAFIQPFQSWIKHRSEGKDHWYNVILIMIGAVLLGLILYWFYKRRRARNEAVAAPRSRQGLDASEIELMRISSYDVQPLLGEGMGEGKDEDEDDNDPCTICLIHLERREPTCVLSCGHIFHPSCIKQWLKRRAVCPNCVKLIEAPVF